MADGVRHQEPKSPPAPTHAWGRCSVCRLPGLVPVEQWVRPFDPRMPMCGFCGGRLERVTVDLTAEAQAAIEAPHRKVT